MNKHKASEYSNLLNNIQKEQQEIEAKDYTKINRVLAERYQGQQVSSTNYIRQSISVTQKEIQLSKELQRQLASSGELLNKSQLYRAGLVVLQALKPAELTAIVKELNS